MQHHQRATHQSILQQSSLSMRNNSRRTSGSSSSSSSIRRRRRILLLWSCGYGAGAALRAVEATESSNNNSKEQQTCRSDGSCAAASANNNSDNNRNSDNSNDHELECGLYLAESTISGAGLGIFHGGPGALRPGDAVGHGDVCVPVVDMYWHNDANTLFNPFKDYFWQGDNMGMAFETAREDVEALCPGLDCAINCHLALINVEKSVPQYDDGLLQRERDPGAGAFTPYHNGTTVASHTIPAGGELFKHYGDTWFTYRNKIFGKLPLTDDYPAAEELLEKFLELKLVQGHVQMQDNPASSKEKQQQQSTTQQRMTDFYNLIVNTINARHWESRTLNALPSTWEDALVAAQADDGLRATLQPHHTRSLAWLQERGTCIDNIRPGFSALPQAGHGAFATRFLPAHSVITRSPVHHLPDYSRFMTMYSIVENEHDDIDDESSNDIMYYRLKDEPIHTQLFYNYCYGHRDSSVLLCPYGAGVSYLNHNQSRANVRVEWADPNKFSLVHNQTLVERGTLADLALSPRPQLGLQYVALRDIEPGEELFLDYGDDWEAAWREHAAQYPRYDEEEDDGPKYASAHFMNTQFHDVPVRTVAEQEFDAYPDNLQIRCHAGLLPARPDPHAEYVWTAVDVGYPCRVEDRFLPDDDHDDAYSDDGGGGEHLYTVVVEWDDDVDEHAVTWLVRTNVPRSAIRFFDLPYTTNLHQPTAFRHEIGLPDEMFPEQWRNLREAEDDDEEAEDDDDDDDDDDQ